MDWVFYEDYQEWNTEENLNSGVEWKIKRDTGFLIWAMVQTIWTDGLEICYIRSGLLEKASEEVKTIWGVFSWRKDDYEYDDFFWILTLQDGNKKHNMSVKNWRIKSDLIKSNLILQQINNLFKHWIKFLWTA